MLTQALTTKPPRRLGPIAELRKSARSPFALTVGSCVGGSAPALSYCTVHWGHLLDGPEVLWRSPLWILVSGALALSSKSIYRWGFNTFGDRWSGVALVLMLELAMLLAPEPILCKVALGLLVAINAAVYGCALAIRDQEDRLHEAEAAAAAAAAAAKSAAAAAETPVNSPAAPKEAPPAKSKAAAAAAPTAESYEAALAYVADKATTSTEAVRTGLRVRHPKAAALVEQLEVQGVVGKPNPLDRGRRPVLLTSAKNVG